MLSAALPSTPLDFRVESVGAVLPSTPLDPHVKADGPAWLVNEVSGTIRPSTHLVDFRAPFFRLHTSG